MLLVGGQICVTSPRSLTHTNLSIYLYVCIHISCSLNTLLKFIYVTGWLDPKSCVYVFMNKSLPVSLTPFSLCPHKLKPCLAAYIIALD